MDRHGRFENFRIGPSFSNQIGTAIRIESNLEALQGPTEDRMEKPLHRLHPIAEIKVNYNKKD